MDKHQTELRWNHEIALVEKLKNPNNVVSKTRLVLKNLPKKGLTEPEIKTKVFELIGARSHKDRKALK